MQMLKTRAIKDRRRRCNAATEIEVGVVCRRELEQGNQVCSVGTTEFEAWNLCVIETSNATEGYEHSEMKALDGCFRRKGGLSHRERWIDVEHERIRKREVPSP